MTGQNLRGMIVVTGMMLVGLIAGTGCQSQPEAAAAEPVPLKPIERVRSGLLVVSMRLDATMESADAIVESAGLMELRTSTFRDGLQSMRLATQQLRADLTDLRQRADEYIRHWSGQTVGVGSEGQTYNRTDPRRQPRVDKYNEMLAALTKARDEAGPLVGDLERLGELSRKMDAQKQQQFQTMLRPVRERADRTKAYLAATVARLDELRAMFNEQKTN